MAAATLLRTRWCSSVRSVSAGAKMMGVAATMRSISACRALASPTWAGPTVDEVVEELVAVAATTSPEASIGTSPASASAAPVMARWRSAVGTVPSITMADPRRSTSRSGPPMLRTRAAIWLTITSSA